MLGLDPTAPTFDDKLREYQRAGSIEFQPAKVAAKFPNAIGYLPADQMTSDIQAVKVDGVAYTDARYAIVAQ